MNERLDSPEPDLDGRDKALERMKQERSSPGRDTQGGDATATDAEGTAPRRGGRDDDQPATVVTPPEGN
jgi:hypothetical protein